jgi:hypothetical protein
MVNCNFCGKAIPKESKVKKEVKLIDGNYCDECKNKDINELYNEILDDEECD